MYLCVSLCVGRMYFINFQFYRCGFTLHKQLKRQNSQFNYTKLSSNSNFIISFKYSWFTISSVHKIPVYFFHLNQFLFINFCPIYKLFAFVLIMTHIFNCLFFLFLLLFSGQIKLIEKSTEKKEKKSIVSHARGINTEVSQLHNIIALKKIHFVSMN